jgi:hypothetical protein
MEETIPVLGGLFFCLVSFVYFLFLMEDVIGKKGPIGCPQSQGERMQMTILFVCLSHKSGSLKRLPGKKK